MGSCCSGEDTKKSNVDVSYAPLALDEQERQRKKQRQEGEESQDW